MANLSLKKEISQETFDFISIQEFCDLTELKQSYVYQLTSKGMVKTYKPFGKKIYVKISEVKQMFEKSASITADEISSEAINYVYNPKKK